VKPILAALVFLWGAAEAVFFFVVADVPITLMTARSGFRTGIIASLWATFGALFGGIIVYFWAGIDAASVDRMLDWVPAVSPAQIAATKRNMAENWIAAMLIGGFSGEPYKLYAAAAGDRSLALKGFMAVTIFARFSRFLASAVLAHGLTLILKRIGQGRWALPLIGLFWVAFYAWYWTRMSW
jgi:hypothetical protein